MNLRDEVKTALRRATIDPNGETLLAEFLFDAGQSVFAGHFPGDPMLPGVFHIQLLRCAMESATGRSYDVRAVPRGKFARAVRPGDAVVLKASIKPSDQGLLVRGDASVDGALVASLSVVLSGVPAG